MWVTEVEQDCVANARNNNSKHVSNNGEKNAEKNPLLFKFAKLWQ